MAAEAAAVAQLVQIGATTAKLVAWYQEKKLPEAVDESGGHLLRAVMVLSDAQQSGMPACFYQLLAKYSEEFAEIIDAAERNGQTSAWQKVADFAGLTVTQLNEKQLKVAREVQLVMSSPYYAAALTNKMQVDHRESEAFASATINRTMVRVRKNGRTGIIMTIKHTDDIPYKVVFSDGLVPGKDWFSESQLTILTVEEINHLSIPIVLVVGMCGEGKSSLINLMKDEDIDKAKVGSAAEGVTKQEAFYRCTASNGKKFYCMDVPGMGDADITADALVAMINNFAGKRLFNCIVFMSEAGGKFSTDTRLLLEVFQRCVKSGFENVILCLSKADQLEDEDGEKIMKDEDRQPMMDNRVSNFTSLFGTAPGKTCFLSRKEPASFQKLRGYIEFSLADKVLWDKMSPAEALAAFTKVLTEKQAVIMHEGFVKDTVARDEKDTQCEAATAASARMSREYSAPFFGKKFRVLMASPGDAK